jgi:DNA-binding GntR family transcriptional regulator
VLRRQVDHGDAVIAAVRTVQDMDRVRAETGEFHRLIMEQSGLETIAVIGEALATLVSRHHALVYDKLQHADLKARIKRVRTGARSHRKLVDLIEAGAGDAAAAHWASHMRETGSFWLDGVGGRSVVDIID